MTYFYITNTTQLLVSYNFLQYFIYYVNIYIKTDLFLFCPELKVWMLLLKLSHFLQRGYARIIKIAHPIRPTKLLISALYFVKI